MLTDTKIRDFVENPLLNLVLNFETIPKDNWA